MNRTNSGRFQGDGGAPIQRANIGRVNSTNPAARPRSNSPSRVPSTGFATSQTSKANDLMRPSSTTFSQAKAPSNMGTAASPYSSIQRSRSPTSVGMRNDVEAANFRANVNAYSQLNRPVSGAGAIPKRYDRLRAQMDDIPVEEPPSSPQKVGSEMPMKSSVLLGPDDAPDRFKGENPLQFAIWGHYMTHLAMYLCFVVGVFAILWDDPYAFDCEINGTLINATYIYDPVTETGVCKNPYKPSIEGAPGPGSIYIIYSFFLFIVDNRYFGWGLYYPNDSYYYIIGISPLAISHLLVGIVGLPFYSTTLAAVPLIAASVVLFYAAWRQESGDGGRQKLREAKEAAAKKKEQEIKSQPVSAMQEGELNCLEKLQLLPMQIYDKFLEIAGVVVEYNPGQFYLRLVKEEKLSLYFWTLFYIFLNLVTFWVVQKDWIDKLHHYRDGLLRGTLDISCGTEQCKLNKQMATSGPLSEIAPWAKASAWCINLNCHLILLPVTKILLSKIYNQGVSWDARAKSSNLFAKFFAGPFIRYFPLHKNIDMHKLCAGAIFFFSFIHMVSHYGVLVNSGDTALVAFKMYGWSYFAYFSGAILILCMFFIYSGAFEEVRRANYEAFFFSHHFYILFFFFLFIHARSFWMWGVWPVMLYLYEKWISRYRGILPFAIIKVEWIEPVLAVYFRPLLKDTYKFKEGQYLHLNCPAISASEWHPFTISSASEDLTHGPLIHIASGEAVTEVPQPPPNVWPADARWKKYCRVSHDWRPLQINAPHSLLDRSDVEYFDMISVHIKVLGKGSWTYRFKEYLQQLEPRVDENGDPLFPIYFSRMDERGDHVVGKQYDPQQLPLIRVDGPHSAPAEHYHHYKTLMLVGAGIGMTPCSSILTSLIKYKWKKGHQTEILHFYWVIRYDEVDSFQWFVHLLTELSFELKRNKENRQTERQYYLEINIYVTGAPKIGEVGLQLAPLKRAPMKYSDSYGTPGFTAEQLYALLKSPKVDSRTQKEQMSSINTAKNRLQNIWVWNGRPQWEIIFADLKEQRQHNEIGCVFCGTPAIGADLKEMCDKHSSVSDQTIFTLHKENF